MRIGSANRSVNRGLNHSHSRIKYAWMDYSFGTRRNDCMVYISAPVASPTCPRRARYNYFL